MEQTIKTLPSVNAILPKTTFQKIIFGLIMSYTMAYGMELYNISIKMGIHLSPGGFSNLENIVFLDTLKEASFMGILVFIISNLFGNRIGIMLAEKRINIGKDSPFFCQLTRQACTIAIMCPTMSLVASIIFSIVLGKKPIIELPAVWVGTMIKNFPMAFFWNMYFASPFTRKIFSILFNGHFSRQKS